MSLRKYFAGLSANTFLLALASLFGDVSSEMLYPVQPVFLTQTLGASPTILGLVEGIAQAAQYIVQGFSGWLSDQLGRRKPVAVAGYAVAALAKPLIGLAGGWPGVLAARTVDRLGSGGRSAPRDALIAASATDASRGKAFGLEGIGDNLGACLGPLIALALLGHVALRSIFLIAIIPGVLALLMILLVRERRTATAAPVSLDGQPGRFPRRYWTYLGITALFGIGNSSNTFLILRATDLGASLNATILIYALFNFVAALASYPAGHFADTVGRKGVLLLSFLVFLVVYAGFGLTQNIIVIGCLFVFYGLHQGIYRAVGKTLATDFVPAELRASAVGWYSATIGVTGLIASVVGGELWVRVGPPATFYLGVGSALAGSIALALFVPGRVTRS
jgi:MFS family permease